MVDFLHFLKNTSYPGRGILVGKDRVYYFIMGRSENSRNRVFVKTDDGIRTEAYDMSSCPYNWRNHGPSGPLFLCGGVHDER